MRDRGEEALLVVAKVYPGSLALSPDGDRGVIMEGETLDGEPVYLKLLVDPLDLLVALRRTMEEDGVERGE